MCGVFGIISDNSVADALYHGMIQLQHRGQDAAGVYAYHPETRSQTLYRDKGLVTEIFIPEKMPLPEAQWGLAHVRYPTAGSGDKEEAQPQYIIHGEQTVAMSQNGNVVNYVKIAEEYRKEGRPFSSGSDVEAILRTFSDQLPEKEVGFSDVCRAVKAVFDRVEGGYSIIGMINGVGMFAFRDPKGIKPLLHGLDPRSKTHAFASETEALSFLGFVDIHSLSPGEVVWVDAKRRVKRRQIAREEHAHCSFEWVYFSRPNSELEGKEVYKVRSKLGVSLAEKIKEARIDADVVVAVPESARPAAIAVANTLQIPYEEGLIRKEYVGRTFIMPTQAVREKALSRKLAVVNSVFKGKNVLLVDDSIVRGTVSRKVVRLARLAGAKKVYFASSYPPIRHSCHYGIDFPDPKRLIGSGRTLAQIASAIDADALIYNDIEGLQQAIGATDLCMACLNGKYPVGEKDVAELQKLRGEQLDNMEKLCLQ